MSWANLVGKKEQIIKPRVILSADDKRLVKQRSELLKYHADAVAELQLFKHGMDLTTIPLQTKHDVAEYHVLPVLEEGLPFIPTDMLRLILQYIPGDVQMDTKFPTRVRGWAFFGFPYGIHRYVTRCGYWFGNHNHCGHENDPKDPQECWNVLAYELHRKGGKGLPSIMIVFRSKEWQRHLPLDWHEYLIYVEVFFSFDPLLFQIDYSSRRINPHKLFQAISYNKREKGMK